VEVGIDTMIVQVAMVVDVVTEMTVTLHVEEEVAETMVVVTTKVAEDTEVASLLVAQADRTTTVPVVVMTTAGVKRLVVAYSVAMKGHSCYHVFCTY